MFLGAGGSGKSSLLDGLMNIALKEAESTALAETRTVSCTAANVADEAWKEQSSLDDARNLAMHSRRLVESNNNDEYITDWKKAAPYYAFKLSSNVCNLFKKRKENRFYLDGVSKLTKKAYKDIIEKAKQHNVVPHQSNLEVVMHIWDCGGQPVFLDIMSAFLTPRTMFMLLFDASIDLNSKYVEKWHHKGDIHMGKEQNISYSQLIMQWLQLIHSSLVTNDDGHTHTRKTMAPPKFPRAILVGSRYDIIKESPGKAEAVTNALQSMYGSATFGGLVVDNLLVDNTKAGKGKEAEDPGYKKIREKVNKFAESLSIPTPLSWVVFRLVLMQVAKGPTLTYSEVLAIALECSIPEDIVPSVLHFYHQLGVILHYATIPSLANTIIVKPQWLIDQLRQLLMPAWYGHRSDDLQSYWRWLEDKGVLAEELYESIWENCELQGGAKMFVDVLDHFDLIKEISEYPEYMKFREAKRYFVPCMLKRHPCVEKGLEEGIRNAVTLHIAFNMGYVPPGFYIRLIAQMTKQGFTPLIDQEVFRDSIIFKCREIDRIVVHESLKSISIKILRRAQRDKDHIRFAESCVLLRHELSIICNNVIMWMPSISYKFAFICCCGSKDAEHLVFVESKHDRNSILFCTCDKQYDLSLQQKYWLPSPEPLPVYVSHITGTNTITIYFYDEILQAHIEDVPLTHQEIQQASRVIASDYEDIAEEMEMQYSLKSVEKEKERREPAYAVISDFVEGEGGTRYELAQFLENAGYIDLSRK